MKRFHKKILIVGGIILIAVVAIGITKVPFIKNKLLFSASCGSSNNIFTTSPVDVRNIDHIVPLGNLNPPGHTLPTKHMYFNFTTKDKSNVDVVAPADLHITGMKSANYLADGFTDYEISFTPCRDVTGYFIHLDSLSPKLKEAYKEADNDDCTTLETGLGAMEDCFINMSVTVEEGEKIGTANWRAEGFALDFGLVDERIKAPYVAGADRRAGDFESVVCPIDYFADDLKKQLYRKVGGQDRRRTVEPICGTVHQDIEGKAQGAWFSANKEEGHSEMMYLALVHDNIDGSKSAISMGSGLQSLGVESHTFYFESKATGKVNRDFKDVGPDGKVYCYEFPLDLNYTFLFQVLDNKTLLAGKGDGSRCSGNESIEKGLMFVR